MRMIEVTCGAAALALGLLVACGGGGSTTTPTTNPTPVPSTAPVQTNTITITANGATPADIVVAVGSRVSFVNQSGGQREPSSNPHPSHTGCPEINIAPLANGQTGQTQVLNTARTCGFHDHLNPGSTALQGTITIR